MEMPSVDKVEGGALLVGLGLLAYGLYLLAGKVGDAVDYVGDIPRGVSQSASDWSSGNPTGLNDIAAPLADDFNPDHWRPAGFYTSGGTLVLATGGMELKPEYRTENGGPGR